MSKKTKETPYGTITEYTGNKPPTLHPVSNTSPADVVKPSVVFEGDKEHALITLFRGPEEELPLVKSIGYMKLPGHNKYVSYVITSKGDKVLSFEVEQPDFRAIAEEAAKIAFVTCFMDQE